MMLWYFANMPRRTKLKAISLVLISLIIGTFFPHSSVRALTSNPKPVNSTLRTGQGDVPIFSDLNGDRNPDQVQLFAGDKSGLIHIRFARGESKQLLFESQTIDQGLLYADDIDNDNALDLIWIVRNRPDTAVIWLGDGRGNFETVKDISPYKSNLAHLYIDPSAPGVFSDLAGKNPGCITGQWTDFQLLSDGTFSPVPALQSQMAECGIPAKELDSSLTQLQVRPPPSYLV
jgi:hypothetical protein